MQDTLSCSTLKMRPQTMSDKPKDNKGTNTLAYLRFAVGKEKSFVTLAPVQLVSSLEAIYNLEEIVVGLVVLST